MNVQKNSQFLKAQDMEICKSVGFIGQVFNCKILLQSDSFTL